MAVLGYQPAARSARAIWIRITLALALVIPAMTTVARPAAAAASLQVKLLKDLDTGNSGGDSSVWVSDPVNADTKYYFAAEVAGDTELYVSDGTPGSATKIDIWTGETAGIPNSSYPEAITAIPGTSKILFVAENGSEGTAGPRLFVSDGTPGGTGPFRPEFFGGSPGFGNSPGAAEGLYEVEGPVTTSTKGLVFSALVDKTGTANDSEFEYIFRTTDGITVSPPYLNAGGAFDYRNSGWNDPTPVANSAYPDPTGFLASVGDVVYASWSDCDPAAVDFACQSPYTGDELRAVNLNAGMPTWVQVTESNTLDDNGPSTTFGRPLGATAGGILFFEAKPAGGDPGIYRTNGSLAGTFEVATDWTYGASAETTVMGSYLYYVSDDGSFETLRRVTTTAGSSEIVITCFDADPLEQEVVGATTLYFVCDLEDVDDAEEGDQYSGYELFAVTNAALVLGVSDAHIVYDAPDAVGGGGGDGLAPSSLKAFDSKLYFSALDTTAYTDRQLWAYTTGTETPPSRAGVDLKDPGNDNVDHLAVAGTSLFFRAEDGTHGNEPFVARVAYTLTVDGSGAGTGTVTGGLSINCTVTAGTEGASGCSGAEAGTITLTPDADDDSTFDGWSGCDGYSGLENVNCVVEMDGDTTVVPTFLVLSAGPWDLTVTKGGLGKGTVTSSTGFTCRGACSSASTSDIANETTVTLTAKAASGSAFVRWQNVDCNEAQTSLVCTFDIGADETDVIARFELKQTVSVLRSGLGAGSTVVTSSPSGIACGATCSTTFGLGAEVVLTAALADGSFVTSWVGVSCDEGEPNTTTECTFTVDGPAQVVVTTTAPSATQYTLSLTNRTAYAITSSTGGINCGIVCQWPFPAGTITLSITMPQAYRPTTTGLTWSCGGCSISGGNRTFTATVTVETSDLNYTVRRARY